MPSRARLALLASLLVAASPFAAAQAPGYPPGSPPPPEIKYPAHIPARNAIPATFVNMKKEPVSCTANPWKQVDHCSMPSPDPATLAYKKVFIDACDEHDICYRTLGNTKQFCDDQFFNGLKRICDHRNPQRSGVPIDPNRESCFAAANAWGRGMKTNPQPTVTAFKDDQGWAKKNCKVSAAAK